MKICYVASDWDAPGFYRCLSPARQLKERGHRVTMPPYKEREIEDGRLLIEYEAAVNPPRPMADIWVLQQRKERMWTADGGIQALRQHGVVTVADCDDNYLELPAYNPAFIGTHPYRKDDGTIRNRAERRALQKALGVKVSRESNGLNRDHMHRGFERVDAMTVSTPYLKDLYSRFNSNITVIRNYLDWEMWEGVTPQYEVERERVRIGYMGVFKYRRGDLDVLKPVIRPFLEKHPEVDFIATSPETYDYLEVPQAQRVPPTGEVSFRHMGLPGITAVMDIGLVPLVPNGLNEAKSHLKGMEYNACGIPFIASPTESYKEYWCDGTNGRLAGTESDWVSVLEGMVFDDQSRREMGRAGRAKAQRHSIQRNAGEWESFYLGLLGDDEDTIARQALAKGCIQKTGELGGLLRYLKGRKLRTIVEIGSARGGTFWAWCQVADDDALLVSIDMPQGEFAGPETGGMGILQRHNYSLENMKKMKSYLRGEQRAEFIHEDSQQETTRAVLESILQEREIDFLFIDGDHSYQGAKRDYELYSPLVADGGVIALHDIISNPVQKQCQVHRLWGDLKGKPRTTEFYDSNTWGYGRWAGIGCIEKERARVAA